MFVCRAPGGLFDDQSHRRRCQPVAAQNERGRRIGQADDRQRRGNRLVHHLAELGLAAVIRAGVKIGNALVDGVALLGDNGQIEASIDGLAVEHALGDLDKLRLAVEEWKFEMLGGAESL